MLARRFLWVVAGLIVLVLVGAVIYRTFEDRLFKLALVPDVKFEESAVAAAGPSYADAAMWIARPDIANHPALWLPAGYQPQQTVRVMLDPAGHPFCLYLDPAD